MDNKFELINNLIYVHDCSLKIFNSRYERGCNIILGYNHLIEGIEELLTGGDMDWHYCSNKLVEHDNLPIVLVFPEDSIISGLMEIERKISENTKEISLKEYLENVSEIFSEIVN